MLSPWISPAFSTAGYMLVELRGDAEKKPRSLLMEFADVFTDILAGGYCRERQRKDLS